VLFRSSPIRPQAAPAPEEISPANPQTVVDSYTPASENDVGKYQPYGLNEKDLRNYAATKMLGATQGMGEAAETGTATADEAEAQIAELEGKIDKKEQEAAAEKGGSVADSSRPQGKNGEPLNDEEMQLISELQSRDTEVRAHEAAHVAASQGYSSGSASFEYQTGPDGKRYAVGGEVSIDTSSESTPEATIRKMQVVRSAALAPAQFLEWCVVGERFFGDNHPGGVRAGVARDSLYTAGSVYQIADGGVLGVDILELGVFLQGFGESHAYRERHQARHAVHVAVEIGRASCRERV